MHCTVILVVKLDNGYIAHIACGRVESFDMDIRMNVSLGRELSTITSHTDDY